MADSFIELLDLVPKKNRTERILVLLALFAAIGESSSGLVRTATVREILVSHLRAESPSNVSDVLCTATGYVQGMDDGEGRNWKLTASGLALLSRLTGRTLSHHNQNEKHMYSVERMHPSIREASEDLLSSGHPAEAIGRAVKRLNQMVRTKTSRTRDEGTSMMHQVFSPNSNGHKRLVLGRLQEDWQRDRQEGLKMMMAGVQLAIANVDKHGELNIGDPTRAIETLATLSLLARAIDECEVAG